MTLNRLIKELQKLRANGEGRSHVAVNKESLWDGNNTFVICDVKSVEAMTVNIADDDGVMAVTSKGVERTRRCVVLKGGA